MAAIATGPQLQSFANPDLVMKKQARDFLACFLFDLLQILVTTNRIKSMGV
jgi:hypothetical protein